MTIEQAIQNLINVANAFKGFSLADAAGVQESITVVTNYFKPSDPIKPE